LDAPWCQIPGEISRPGSVTKLSAVSHRSLTGEIGGQERPTRLHIGAMIDIAEEEVERPRAIFLCRRSQCGFAVE
jgi:hypothetical protein